MGWTPRTLKGQLTLLFLIMTLVPSLIVTALVTRRLLDAVARWEQPGVQRALTGSLDLARDMMGRAENDLLQRAQLLAADSALEGELDAGLIRERLASAYNLDFVQVYDESGTLVFETTRDPFVPPPGALELTGSETFLHIDETGLLAHVGFLGPPDQPERVLVVGNFLGQDFYPRFVALSDADTFYRQLPFLIRVRQRAFLLGVIAGVLLLGLISTWIARRLATRVSRPVEALGRGMERLSAADEAVNVAPQGGEEMERLIATFNVMSSELSRSREVLAQAERQAAWREMARRVAHEMRNALTPVTFSVHKVRKLSTELGDEHAQRLQKAMDTVVDEVEGLKRLASSFGELARLPAPEMIRLDLTALAAAVADATRDENLTVHGPDAGTPLWTLGDRTLLRQALTNLFRNGAEATGGKGSIWVSVGTAEGQATVTVEDDGPGWPEKDRDRLTQPYVTTKPEGTGLGLSLVQRTVFQHGGSMTLGDRDGGGARVTLYLPLSGKLTGKPESEARNP